MTLYEYISIYHFNDAKFIDEVTVFDRDYDVEVYFYRPSPNDDLFEKAKTLISKKLDVVGFCGRGVVVNLSDVIERNLDNGVFEELFIHNDVDSIMDDIENIFSGYVSDQWLMDFANSLDSNISTKTLLTI